MRNFFIILLIFFCIICTTCSSDKSDRKLVTLDIVADGKPLKKENIETKTDFFIKDTKGNYYNMEDFKGKRVFVNYWATWCKPCIAEMPDIESVARTLERENYLFFFISDQPMSKIEEFAEKSGFNLTFTKLNGTMEKLKIRLLPTTTIYNTDGNKVRSFEGAIKWNQENILKSLREIN